MNETVVISVSRKGRPSETLLRRLMAALGVLFLLLGITASTGFMLPCALTVMCYYWYRHVSKREYEIPANEIILVCEPDAPEAQPYKKHGTVPVKKEDYTSYREGVPWYTVIVRDQPKTLKLLLDLTPEAIRLLRRWNREAVKAKDAA